ncbi:MAG: SpoIID/LytB domain-containing protein [Candidatus Melainabacteria bacterium]|nr:SpoIID/LytB domain-containing protein [Candidatus Melainabacteria bacterium]
MVDSVSVSKTKPSVIETDDSETVVCMAAIAAYLAIEADEQLAAASAGPQKPTTSPWREASLLEGTQGIANNNNNSWSGNKQSLWKNFLGAFAFTALSLLIANAAGAQTYNDANAEGYDLNAYERNTADDTIYTARASSQAASPYGNAASQPRRFTDNIPIRVAIALNVPEISVDAIDGAQVLDMSTGRQIAALQPLSQWRLGARTANGAASLTVSGRRDVDKFLIASGDQIKTNERGVAFFPSQYIGPPALKAFQAQQADFNVGAAKRGPISLTISCPTAAPNAAAAQANVASVLKGVNSRTPAQSADGMPDQEEATDEDAEYTLGTPNQSNRLTPVPSGKTIFDTLIGSGITSGVIIAADQNNSENSQYVFTLNGRMYRGALWIRPTVVKDKNGAIVTRLTAINVLDLEDYLMSVIPSEMPSSWPREALKAQAIAARSYAIANLGKYGTQGFDVKATVLDQAYRGAVAETSSTNRAVSETKGIVMKHQGKVVPGFFHSSSAGHTDVAEHVWTKEVPYLKSVPDVDHKSKYVLWDRKFAMNQIDSLLGKDVGTVLGLFPVHRSPAGRVKNMLVLGTNGSTFVAGSTIRQLFALPSTNFNVLAYQDSYVFRGQGFGHGLGMSQYGARTLAEHGYNAGQILTYYYKDVTFEQIAETPAL